MLAALGKRDPDTGREEAPAEQIEAARAAARRIKRISAVAALGFAAVVAGIRLYVRT